MTIRSDEEVFNIFIHWWYMQKIVPENTTVADLSWQTKAELYVFTNFHGCSALKSDTTDLMVEHTREVRVSYSKDSPGTIPPNSVVCYVWANILACSPLRRLMVDIYAYLLILTRAEDKPGSYPHKFLRDVSGKDSETANEWVQFHDDFGWPVCVERYHEPSDKRSHPETSQNKQ
ncbi:hypothetical protein MMC27_003902 [Xylographa pallens]|nr:hypothetical protein [Xylographa pallens]